MERWKAEVRQHRRSGDRRAIAGLAASLIVQTLAWTLRQTKTPTEVVKID